MRIVVRESVRFPFYPAAGHMVTHRAPGELLEDIEIWFDDG